MAAAPAPPPARRPARAAVFLRDFVDLARPLDEVRLRLCGGGGWLVPLDDSATDDGATLEVRLSPLQSRRRLGVPVTVRLDRASEHGATVLIPIRWEAASLSGLFPVLDGNVELSALGEGACRLSLSASYRPPLDAVGEWLDRVAVHRVAVHRVAVHRVAEHRVAESTVRSFLGLVASRLGEEPAAPASG